MPQKYSNTLAVDVSVIITAHAESILIHKTLASVRRAIKQLDEAFTVEIILHVDNPTQGTENYIAVHKTTTLSDVKVLKNTFGDLGASRNFAIKQATGKYISTIDADDLMSENWISHSVSFLEKQTDPTVAHSELTVEFEGTDSIIIKHGEINKPTDTLLSVYANRWNSVIIAPRQLLLDEPYTPNSAGYGYEDWHLNCRLIYKDVHNILIPETAIFVRRKAHNSEWLRQVQSMAVLRANPLLSFKNIRTITTNPFPEISLSPRLALPNSPTSLRHLTKKVIKRHPLTYKTARGLKLVLTWGKVNTSRASDIPQWLKQEWRHLHSIDRQLFPSSHLTEHITTYDSLTPEHKLAGSLYKQIVNTLHHDSYDYLIFVPWLIKGGADKYAINYANTIAEANPTKRVLVIATLPLKSVWQDRLGTSVDFLDFGSITQDASVDIKYRLMGHLIENAGIDYIHIINSEFGYDFIRLHEEYIKATDKKVIVTSFSQSVDAEERLYGYSHTHVPFVYDIASLITSDNQSVVTMWEKEYGFDPKKMLVHRQSIALDGHKPKREKPHIPLRVLWAARVSPEKRPELLAKIGRLTEGFATIDVYGTIEHESRHHLEQLPRNVKYRGNFDGLMDIPLNEYDCLLYTSLFDGMPNTLLEAAQEYLPVIASDAGGVSEFIMDTTGILIQRPEDPRAYSDAIELLFKQPELASKLALNAYAKLEDEFSPQRYESDIKLFLKRLGY